MTVCYFSTIFPIICRIRIKMKEYVVNTHEKLSCSLSNTIEAPIPPSKLEKVLNKKCKKSEMCSPRNKQMQNSRILIKNSWKQRPIGVWNIFTLHKQWPLCNELWCFLLVYVSSVKSAFRIHFSVTQVYNVTDYTRTRNMKAHFIEDTVYMWIMRNIQCFIIKAFVDSSTYPVYAQQCPCIHWAIHTNEKRYHCMKKGITSNIFYHFPREKKPIENHNIQQTFRITLA